MGTTTAVSAKLTWNGGPSAGPPPRRAISSFASPSLIIAILATVAAIFTTSAHAAQSPISLQTLLKEMVDRAAQARWPNPPYTCREFTSYDRRSVSPDKPGWFANEDQGNYLRVEENHGRKEWVMMDADGPGAIVCFFKATTDPMQRSEFISTA